MKDNPGNRVGRRYQVAVNDDGSNIWQYRQVPFSAEEFQRAVVDRMSDADLLCWGAGNTRFWYGSNVTEHLDTGQQVFPTVQEWMVHTTLRSLRDTGQDPLALVCARGHQHGMHVYASLRMNDGHFAFPPPANSPEPGTPDFGVPAPDQLWNHMRGAEASPLTSEFWRRYPEFHIGENWPGCTFAADLLDYTHTEVRARWIVIITDIADRFEIDGVELDFMRNPFFFPPSGVTTGRPLMTALVREIRDVLDEAGRKRGRTLGLAARCPTSLSGCDAIGLDVETWVNDGLLDVLIPSPTRTNKFEIDLRPMAAIGRGSDCQVISGMDTVMPNQTWEQVRALQSEEQSEDLLGAKSNDEYRVLETHRHRVENKRGVLEGMPINLWRALAANAYLDGLDGIYVFNLWDQLERHGRHLDRAILRDVRSPETLSHCDKLYALDFEISAQATAGHPEGHLTQPASLPLILTEKKPVDLRLKIADELTNIPQTELEEVRLHLLLVNLTPVDQLCLKLNGDVIDEFRDAPTLRPGSPTGPNTAFVDLIYDLRQRVPKTGINVFTVELTHKNHQVQPDIYLRELELSIRYQKEKN